MTEQGRPVPASPDPPSSSPDVLRQSEEMFRLLVESMQEYAIFLLDTEGRVATWNAGARRMKGYEAGEIIGRHFSTFYPEEVKHTKPAAELEVASRAGQYREEGWRLRKDGSAFWADVTITALRDATGRLRGFAKVIHDITERKAAEERLRQKERELEEAQRLAHLGSWAWDLRSGAVWWSDEMCRIAGLEPGCSPPTYEGLLATVHPEDRARIDGIVRGAVSSGGTFAAKSRLVRRDGEVRAVHLVGAAELGAEGKAVRLVATAQDVTEANKAEATRSALVREQAARGEAEKANRMKDEFLATLSHELRTPLNAIVGWAHMLRSGRLDADTTARAIAAVDRNAGSLTQLISDVLDVSRIASGKLHLQIGVADLAAVTEAAADTVRPAVEAKQIELQLLLDRGAGPVSGDAARLQQVVWNLLSNAVKFTPKRGRVQVVLRRVDSHVHLAVHDNGIGIRPDFLPHVFEQFRQADPSPTRKHGGLGLGLSIVKQLVELHGGRVRAESAGEHQGSSFIVELPLLPLAGRRDAREAAPAEPAPAAWQDSPRLDGVRVLVVDDAQDAREVIQTALTGLGAEVEAVPDAATALARLPAMRPDVLIADIEMPGESGYDLMRHVRALSAAAGGLTPAVALTAYARPEDRLKALIAGFQIHVAKPVEPAELAVVVASLAARLRPSP